MKGENGVKSFVNLENNIIVDQEEVIAAEEKVEESMEENIATPADENSIGNNAVLSDENSEEIAEHAEMPEKNPESFVAMITTIDNPFDPFDQFDDWFRYDEEKGFHTCSYLGRIARTDDEMSDEEFRKAIEQAIDEILKYDFMNIYKKVRKPISKVESFE